MSKRLHRREVTQILRSVAVMRSTGNLVTCTRHRTPLAYFDDKPIGRILSRFSQDVFVLDFQVGNAWNNAFGLATAMVVDAIVLTVAGTPDASVRAPTLLTACMRSTLRWHCHIGNVYLVLLRAKILRGRDRLRQYSIATEA